MRIAPTEQCRTLVFRPLSLTPPHGQDAGNQDFSPDSRLTNHDSRITPLKTLSAGIITPFLMLIPAQIPAPGSRVRSAPLHGSADALLIAQLARARRPLAVITALGSDAQLVEPAGIAARALVMKPKPLLMFMNMLFQQTVVPRPKEAATPAGEGYEPRHYETNYNHED